MGTDSLLAADRAKRDPAENEDSTPADDEELRIATVWVAEAYTSATVNGLLGGLANLGWEHSLFHTSAPDWIRAHRGSASAGERFPFGWITPAESRPIGVDYTAPMPNGFNSAYATMLAVGPSVTMLTIGFVPTEHTSRALDRLLRQTYSTIRRPSTIRRGLVEWVGPRNQKQEAVQAEIARQRRTCSDWVRRNAPGTLGGEGDALPGLVVLTTEQHRPFERVPRRDGFHWGWEDITDLNNDWDAWTDGEVGGFLFADRWRPTEASSTPCWLVAGKTGDLLTGADLAGAGSAVDHLTYNLPGTVARLGLLGTLSTFQRRLAQQRDYLVHRPTSKHSSREVESFRRHLVSTTMDAESVADDICRFAEEPHQFRSEVLDWRRPLNPRRAELQTGTLIEAWQESTRWRVDRLVSTQRSVERVVMADSSLRSTVSILRLQHSVRRLTVLALAVTILGIVITLIGAGPLRPSSPDSTPGGGTTEATTSTQVTATTSTQVTGE